MTRSAREHSAVLEREDATWAEPAEPAPERPALLAGEEREFPDRHIFRGID
ncbi:hypothetical protein OG747_52385 (plasmid) [Streptomyces sp. NBC_01384]|uniref:hypothetical protein n=1 Tax=Streptomyces sp. NBC_01384 TaxID=2903847 RepID=UPI003243B40A